MNKVTFSDRVAIADGFIKRVSTFNNDKRTGYHLNTDPLTFISWMASEGLLNDDMCAKKAAEYRLQKSIGMDRL